MQVQEDIQHYSWPSLFLTPGELTCQQICAANGHNPAREVNSLSDGLFPLWLPWLIAPSCIVFSHYLTLLCIAQERDHTAPRMNHWENFWFWCWCFCNMMASPRTVFSRFVRFSYLSSVRYSWKRYFSLHASLFGEGYVWWSNLWSDEIVFQVMKLCFNWEVFWCSNRG